MEAKKKKNASFCIHFFGVRWFHYRLNVKIHVQFHFTVTSQFLRSHRSGIIYTRFLTFYVHIKMELYNDAFIDLYRGEKQVC